MNRRDALAHPQAVLTARGEIGRRLADWEIDAICAGEYAAVQALRAEAAITAERATLAAEAVRARAVAKPPRPNL